MRAGVVETEKQGRTMAYKKGESGNLKGRPPAGNAFIEQLREALIDVEKIKGKSLIRHAIERAYEEDTVLIAIMKKVLPDLQESDLGKRTFEHFQSMIDKFQK